MFLIELNEIGILQSMSISLQKSAAENGQLNSGKLFEDDGSGFHTDKHA